jgi:tol-pal system protein YbgF
MGKTFAAVLALLVFTVVWPASLCAENLSEKVARLEKDLNDLQRQFYKGSAGASGVKGNLKEAYSPAKSSGTANVDYIQIKMGEIEGQFAKITDEVERLSHNLGELEKKLDRLNADYDERFKALEAAVGENKAALAEAAEAREAAVKSKPKVSAKDEYDAAYALIKKNDYAGAQKAFEQFLADFPDDTLAGNAEYWLAESFYVRKDYAKAAVAFAEGYQKYPKNAKAADNFLKLGLSMQAMGNKDEACTVFTSLAKEYPKAAENIKARAKKEAGNLKCK